MDHTQHLSHTWNWGYIALSYVIAAFAAYISLELASRMGQDQMGRKRRLLAQGGLLGYGIWAMHFVGMLAFELDALIQYNLFITVASGLAAVAFVTAALFIVNGGRASWGRFLTGGLVAGFGISVMHYAGMMALQTGAPTTYLTLPFLLSVVIAVAAATIALFLFAQVNSERALQLAQGTLLRLKVAAGLVMGAAIVGMHYTGMAAIQFGTVSSTLQTSLFATDTAVLSILILFATFLVLGLALVYILTGSSNRALVGKSGD
ncbi:MHYT domain-containing protein [Deinococcus oregonensis]|uniref:MHYT domain-containing protein n=1 Tax=Deinococcus oregonensis TaxID=1805970 RepID=A0ABV6B7W4_9DEIO